MYTCLIVVVTSQDWCVLLVPSDVCTLVCDCVQVKECISEFVGIPAHEQMLLGLHPGSRDHMTLREAGIPQIGFMVTVVMVAKEQQQQSRRQQVAMLGEQLVPVVSSVRNGLNTRVPN